MPEIFTARFVTSLTAALSTTSRPTTITVAATIAALGASGATFSILIYNAGTGANPVNAEAFEVTAGGATTTWTVVTESGWTPATHANGSEVLVTVLTPRSLTQPLNDHVTPATEPDPHTIYTRKASFTTKGDLLVGTGASAFTRQGVGADGTTPVADSTQTSGIRWAVASLGLVITHIGDLIIGGVAGVAQRLASGSIGQLLTTVQNSSLIANPSSGPTCSAGTSGGSLGNGTNYDFAFSWSNGATPDGGETLISPITQFTATATGRVNVQAPAAPTAGLTLIIYAATHSGTLHQEGSLVGASTSSTNTVAISAIAGSILQSATNTTGGTSPAWSASPALTGEVSAADFSATGLTGSTAGMRWVGATTGGPPTTGAHVVGDAVVDRSTAAGSPFGWKCTVAGTPGTWVPVNTGVMTAVGDLIIGGAVANGYAVLARLAAGTVGQLLTGNGAATAPFWQSPPGTRVRISADQSITTSGVAQVVNWDTEDLDVDTQHFTSVANLTGTLAKTSASAAVVGTGTSFTTELTVGQVFDLPGTAVETRVVTAITDNTHLTVNATYANTASGQTATRRNSPLVFRQLSFANVEVGIYWASAAVGSFTTQLRLNGTTVIGEVDTPNIAAVDAQSLSINYQFQQWDYVEVMVTQSSGGALNITADQRTHLSTRGR